LTPSHAENVSELPIFFSQNVLVFQPLSVDGSMPVCFPFQGVYNSYENLNGRGINARRVMSPAIASRKKRKKIKKNYFI